MMIFLSISPSVICIILFIIVEFFWELFCKVPYCEWSLCLMIITITIVDPPYRGSNWVRFSWGRSTKKCGDTKTERRNNGDLKGEKCWPVWARQRGATADRRTRDRDVPGSKLAWVIWIFPRKWIGIARWPSSLGMLIRPSLDQCSPIGRPSLLKCKNEYLVLALGEETAVQAVVDFIVWTFRLGYFRTRF